MYARPANTRRMQAHRTPLLDAIHVHERARERARDTGLVTLPAMRALDCAACAAIAREVRARR